MSFLKHITTVALAAWLGAALFFSIVVAPAAFQVLRSFQVANVAEIAGAMVTRSLGVINVSGFVISLLCLIALFLLRQTLSAKVFVLELLSLAVIGVATAVGHWLIAARMRAIRTMAALPIDQLAADDPARVSFNTLHGYSVTALSVAMLAAILALTLLFFQTRAATH